MDLCMGMGFKDQNAGLRSRKFWNAFQKNFRSQFFIHKTARIKNFVRARCSPLRAVWMCFNIVYPFTCLNGNPKTDSKKKDINSLEVSPKWLRKVPPKWHISSRRESVPRSESDIAEVTLGSVDEVPPRSFAEVAHFFPTGVSSAIRMRYRRQKEAFPTPYSIYILDQIY